MIYILAIILPPVALLISGKIFQAILNLILIAVAIVIFVFTFGIGSFLSHPLWIISIIHAVFVVHGVRTDRKLETAVKRAINNE
ncbi:MAG: YqaE/Pmp3 family membrane protein [Calditrichaeota bacterium]|nr:YqaE/Pmp3 family membrane protein [Calditrichota bacterium]